MLNTITIAGRIARDVELRTTQGGVSVATFTVAVDRDFQQGGEKKVDFVRCVAWRQTGEFVSKYFQKGSMIIVMGRLESRQWEDKHSQKRTDWEVIADHVYFGGDKRQENNDFQPPQVQNVSAADFVELDDDPANPLPF